MTVYNEHGLHEFTKKMQGDAINNLIIVSIKIISPIDGKKNPRFKSEFIILFLFCICQSCIETNSLLSYNKNDNSGERNLLY